MISGLFSKILFSILFIGFLQVPILADHYRQYLSGYLDATNNEILHYQSLAHEYGYTSVEQMLVALSSNNDPLIQKDTAHKQEVIANHDQAKKALIQLEQSHYFEQIGLFVQPQQYPRLVKVLNQYQPSLPMHLPSIGAALATTISFYLFLILPFKLLERRKHKARLHFSHLD